MSLIKRILAAKARLTDPSEVAVLAQGIEPLGGYVLVQVFKPEETSAGGIVIPEHIQAQDRQMLALVLEKGPGQRSITTAAFMPIQVERGDVVFINKHAPVELRVCGEIIAHILAEGDIISRIRPEYLEQMAAIEAAEPEIESSEDKIIQETEGAVITERASGILMAVGKE